ncbi:MAG: hypothetical protein AAF215_14770 [Cyanobacteria bacterium P01_A01_bin.123]
MDESVYNVTLVISVVTPDTETHPIEVMLSEFNRRERSHQVHQFKGFSTAESAESARYFINLCQQLEEKHEESVALD